MCLAYFAKWLKGYVSLSNPLADKKPIPPTGKRYRNILRKLISFGFYESFMENLITGPSYTSPLSVLSGSFAP